MLVATKAKARITRAVTIVPSAPMSSALSDGHRQRQTAVLSLKLKAASVTTRNKTAIPKNTHENTGATVIVPVICKKAVTTPSATLRITAKKVQEHLFSEQKLIYSPPHSIVCEVGKGSENYAEQIYGVYCSFSCFKYILGVVFILLLKTKLK